MPEIPTLCDPQDFLCSPIGSATACESLVYWYPSESLRLLALWERPSMTTAETLIELMRCELATERQRHGSLVDLRLLEDILPDSFARFSAFMTKRAAEFSRQIHRSAVIHEGGVTAAAAIGYTRLIGEPFESRAFADPRDGLAWLGFQSEAPGLVDGLDALREQARQIGPVVHQVRRHLRADLSKISLAAVASALGLSPRSLQRSLAEANTSLRAETRMARIERAKTELRVTDNKLFEIAINVGFSSVQSFSDAFHESTGTRPSEWRAEHRHRVDESSDPRR